MEPELRGWDERGMAPQERGSLQKGSLPQNATPYGLLSHKQLRDHFDGLNVKMPSSAL